MGQFYNIKVWLEEREIELLKEFDFSEEVFESSIPENKRWILLDLVIKGMLSSHVVNAKKFYQGSAGYLQHFEKSINFLYKK